ncbi:hypothetical protein BESB_042080 [Besnoitia besnoiti]|uniref:Uncharacterized protein n=1 Tax=Besnoitia besnoiti TaxID=94643 RepID=A0A2A9M1A7_BESBE|nr:uncharacterized protein BESB_042710 [Besnoitia besnoiti]XP_029215034.1 uncharacterized protein BESB_042720 [Besnoitia besnoiti]XP_029215043.1 uncharacterized protein BESB_042080 [Besnoitia besnoiti]PFH31023.1 hypothetical protein BESB_042710 [Besnoitia besnoiti]PFH31024.1 hypothetical protein BESB_042720 [Besnoitia besnoiti]PFH31033.1 hypothetical protein BESB_042080 [Besnoitia besnoiti]
MLSVVIFIKLSYSDATSRHRGAKPPRQYGLSGEISLLSLDLYLYKHFYFTEIFLKTVFKSLHLSCGSELTRQ